MQHFYLLKRISIKNKKKKEPDENLLTYGFLFSTSGVVSVDYISILTSFGQASLFLSAAAAVFPK